MGTKAIREALEHFAAEASFPESPRARLSAAALAEVEAIEKAAREVTELRGHPISSVARWQAVYDLMETIAKEAK